MRPARRLSSNGDLFGPCGIAIGAASHQLASQCGVRLPTATMAVADARTTLGRLSQATMGAAAASQGS